jgi:hypothetical protein
LKAWSGKKELALFGAVRQTVLKQLFCFIRSKPSNFSAKEGLGDREPGPRAAARPVLLMLGSDKPTSWLFADSVAHQVKKPTKDGPQSGTLTRYSSPHPSFAPKCGAEKRISKKVV